MTFRVLVATLPQGLSHARLNDTVWPLVPKDEIKYLPLALIYVLLRTERINIGCCENIYEKYIYTPRDSFPQTFGLQAGVQPLLEQL